ncbi:hypothetical protein MMC22_002366 [Lobaria immixta]|nr:hypothetical protein [Lobaria immixta]
MSAGHPEPACKKLKRHIDAVAVPDDQDIPNHKRFFPQTQLRRLLTETTIQDVLRCSCRSCKSRVEAARESDLVESSRKILSCTILTFALLVHIKCPQFIFSFIHRDFHDGQLLDMLQYPSIAHIPATFWPIYHQRNPAESNKLAKSFKSHRQRFAIPLMGDGLYTIYDESTILPFVNEKPVGTKNEDGEIVQEGACGRIFSFEIVKEYQNIPYAQDVRTFARKELIGAISRRNLQEIENWEHVNKLEDPHIIRMFKAYKHGDTINLVFPCAKTNLDHYLRDRSYHAPEAFQNRPESSPLWNQLLGISKALDRIINYNPSERLEAKAFFGYHFDLKPPNILVEESGRLLITDFGHAIFNEAGSTSGVPGVGGTPAYAPPEIDRDLYKPNRKYDIWSLGCILLEVCTFVVKGHDGVQKFDALRLTRAKHSNVEDDRFFRKRPSSNSSYEIKPEIITWMKQLPDSPRIFHEHSRKFLRSILNLVRQMLCVSVNERLSSTEVCKQLEAILDRFRPVQLDQTLTQQIPCLSYTLYPALTLEVDAPVSVFEDSSGYITTLDSGDNQTREFSIGFRSQLTLIPQIHPSCNENKLFFQGLEDEEPLYPQVKMLSFRDATDATLMQSLLLGQRITHSCGLIGGEIERRSPFRQRFKLQYCGSSIKEQLRSAAIVQLWSEESGKTPKCWHGCQKRNSPRPLKEFLMHGALPRRIVIFYKSSIIIVRLAKNARIEKSTNTNNLTAWRIIPTDKTRDPTFVASMINLPRSDVGIPLDRAILDAEERRGQFECRSLRLVFRNESDARLFHQAYQALKLEWKSQEKQIEELKDKMGQGWGWALN